MTYYSLNKALPSAFKSFYNFSHFTVSSLKQITQGVIYHADALKSYQTSNFTKDPEEPNKVNYYSYRQVYFNDCNYYSYNLLSVTCRLCDCIFADVLKLEAHMFNSHDVDIKSSASMRYK